MPAQDHNNQPDSGGSYMPDESQVNGDTRLILHRLDVVVSEIKDLQNDHKESTKATTERMAECEKAQALQGQAIITLAKLADENKQGLKSNDRWTKITAGVITFVIAVGTAAVGIIGSWFQYLITLVGK